MKKTLSLLLIVVLAVALVFGSGSNALAARKVTKIRTGSLGASFRSFPEVSDCNKICGIHADTVLDVYNEYNGWYYVRYNGEYGWVNASPQIAIVIAAENIPSGTVPQPYISGASSGQCVPSGQNSNSYLVPGTGYAPDANRYPYQVSNDMGIPQIGSTVFCLNQMNLVIFWVQTQLKATGIWYQGDQWDLTGSLGEHTMSEIRSFMASNGYYGHTGVVDQTVLNALARYLGSRIVPVQTGGIYNYMSSIMSGDPYGSMPFIVSNLRDNVPRETVGARWIQTILAELGYYTGSVDGKYGILTQNAVILFQRNNGFQECDYVSLGVARAMLEQYYRLNKNMRLLP